MARPVLGWAALATTAALVSALVPLASTPAPGAYGAREQQRPASTRVDQVRVPTVLAAGRADSDGIGARLGRTATDPYRMVAVTWRSDPGAGDPVVDVRTRTAGDWSGWRHLDVDDDGPAGGETAGTVPLWVGEADGVAVRVRTRTGAVPDSLRVSTIDPAGVPETDRRGALPNAGGPMGRPPRFPGRPPIVKREQWHADPSLGDKCDKPVYARTTKAAIVHHTAGTNDYSRADSVGIVQGILAYHTQSRHWCDIGYNFLVDRFGRVFEGRDGGMAKPVRGAHAGDFNVGSMGMSMMGDFSRARLPRPMKNAIVRTIGWRLGTNYRHPGGTVRLHGQRIDRISGHRDVMSTACPGDRGYRWLPRLRKRAGHYLSRFRSRIRAERDRLGRDVTGKVFVGERRIAGGRRTRFTHGDIYWKRSTGAHFEPHGAVSQGYLQRGGPKGRLGFPVQDYRKTGRGATGRFEHGRIRYDKRTRKVTVTYR